MFPVDTDEINASDWIDRDELANRIRSLLRSCKYTVTTQYIAWVLGEEDGRVRVRLHALANDGLITRVVKPSRGRPHRWYSGGVVDL